MDKLKLFLLKNWKTAFPALTALMCLADSEFWKMMPPEYEEKALKVCVLLNTISNLFAKDADKTHSKVIVQPQTDPVTVPVEGDDAKRVKA